MKFQREMKCPDKTIDKAVQKWLEYNETNSSSKNIDDEGKRADEKRNRWILPPQGFICLILMQHWI